MIREDEFVVPSALQPHMTIGLGVAGLSIVGNFICSENVILVFDPDVAGQRIDLAMLLLLLGLEAYGNTRGRRRNHFSNRIIQGHREATRAPEAEGNCLVNVCGQSLEMTQH